MAEFQTQIVLFGQKGLDLKRALDKIDETSLARMDNVIRYEDGGITGRPGLTAFLYTTDPSLAGLFPSNMAIDEFNPTADSDLNANDLFRLVTFGFSIPYGVTVHSISRLTNPRTGSWYYIVGIGTQLFAGRESLALIAQNFSGYPLSLVPYRPPLSADSYMYIGDGVRMCKVSPDNVVTPIGLPEAETVAERFQIDEFDSVSAASGFDMRDLTRMTCVGFDIAEGGTGNFLSYGTAKTIEVDDFESMSGIYAWSNNAGTGGAPTNILDVGKVGSFSGKFSANDGGAAAGYNNFWIRSLQTASGTGTVTKELTCLAVGNYNAWSSTNGADSSNASKVAAVQAVDGYILQNDPIVSAQTFTVNPPIDASGATPITSIIIKGTSVGTTDGGVTDVTVNFRVRLGGVDVDGAGFNMTSGAYQLDITATRPGGGSWTIADLSTVEIGAVSTAITSGWPNFDKLVLEVQYLGGTLTGGLSLATFIDGSQVTDDDLVHLWMKIDRPDLITEVRFYFITSAQLSTSKLPGTDQTYNTDAYMKAFRPSDFTAVFEATAGAVTTAETANTTQQTMQQLSRINDDRSGVVQIINEQREYSRSQSLQTAPGRGQWTEFGVVGLPLKRGDFKRIGNNTDRGWGEINGLCVCVITNASEDVNVWLDDIYLTGGAGLDSTSPGNVRYNYRVRNYDPRTGTKSNPTDVQGEAYWLDSIRQSIVISPEAYGDSQIRQQFFRQGGTLVQNWYYVGVNNADGEAFTDDATDSEIINAELLEFNNDQPVTTVDTLGTDIYGVDVPCLWGPVQDFLFACGDPNRPGDIYWPKKGESDHWPAANHVEVCAPSEELMNGFVFSGQAFVFSRERLYNIFINTVVTAQVNTTPTTCTKGLIARWAFCVASSAVYFCAFDGIYRTTGGQQENLSDATISSIFTGQLKNGYYPLDRQYPNDIRLWENGNDVWFRYRDTNGSIRLLIFSTTMNFWRSYNFGTDIATGYREEISNPRLLLGGQTTAIVFDHAGTSDNGSAIAARMDTGALNQSLLRQNKQYGDLFLNANCKDVQITVDSLVNFGQTSIGTVSVLGSDETDLYVIDPTSNSGAYGEEPVISQNIQMSITWSTIVAPPIVYHGGPSFVVRPDTIQQRVTDWDYGGRLTDKYVKGIYIDCDTGGINKQIEIQADGATQTTIVAQTTAGRQSLHFSWARFLGRALRLKPIFGGINYLLRAYWRLEEAVDQTRVDATGRGNNLTQTGGSVTQSTLIQGNCAEYSGAPGLRAEFPGADFSPTGNFSISLWFRQTASTNAYLMIKGGASIPGNDGVHYAIYISSGRISFQIGNQTLGQNQIITITSPTIALNTTYFVVAKVEDGVMSIRLNDATTQSATITTSVASNNGQFNLGGATNGSRITGLIDEVGFWHRALQSAEITWLYNEGVGRAYPLVNTEDPFILYDYRWIFDEEPAKLSRWETNELDHGVPGWQIPFYAYITLKSTATVTLTLTVYNQAGVGTDYTYNITSTAGLKIKEFVKFQASKGVFFKYTFTSTAAFYLYKPESSVFIQPWGAGNLMEVRPFGDDDRDAVRGLGDSALSAARSGKANGS